MDDDDVREELVDLLRARHAEHAREEEALRRHEAMNDVLVGVLRNILERLEALEKRVDELRD
jgi:hypothetical protein